MSRRRNDRQPSKLPAKPADTKSAQPANRPSEAIERVSERVSITQSFQGPLPPPGLLGKYNEAFPGCAERIVAMTEQQATHRHALESRVVDGKLTAERRGQTLGFILALTAIVGGCVLIARQGERTDSHRQRPRMPRAVFVYGRRKDAEERKEKRSDFAHLSFGSRTTTRLRDRIVNLTRTIGPRLNDVLEPRDKLTRKGVEA